MRRVSLLEPGGAFRIGCPVRGPIGARGTAKGAEAVRVREAVVGRGLPPVAAVLKSPMLPRSSWKLCSCRIGECSARLHRRNHRSPCATLSSFGCSILVRGIVRGVVVRSSCSGRRFRRPTASDAPSPVAHVVACATKVNDDQAIEDAPGADSCDDAGAFRPTIADDRGVADLRCGTRLHVVVPRAVVVGFDSVRARTGRREMVYDHVRRGAAPALIPVETIVSGSGDDEVVDWGCSAEELDAVVEAAVNLDVARERSGRRNRPR